MFKNLNMTAAAVSALVVVVISMSAPAEARGRHWPGHSWNSKHRANCHPVWAERHNKCVRVMSCPAHR